VAFFIIFPDFSTSSHCTVSYFQDLCKATCNQVRREPQWGPGKHSCEAPKHFCGAPLGRKFLNFSFQNGAFWCTLYFWAIVGPPKPHGAQGSLPPYPTLSMGLLVTQWLDTQTGPSSSSSSSSKSWPQCPLMSNTCFAIFCQLLRSRAEWLSSCRFAPLHHSTTSSIHSLSLDVFSCSCHPASKEQSTVHDIADVYLGECSHDSENNRSSECRCSRTDA